TAAPDAELPGLMHPVFGDYPVADVKVVAGFDVDADKVGKDVSEALYSGQNQTIKIADIPHLGVEVKRGQTHDGLGRYYQESIEESSAEPVDVVAELKKAEADVVVSYLPVGSEEADRFYRSEEHTSELQSRF